jgi:hypothetical protein
MVMEKYSLNLLNDRPEAAAFCELKTSLLCFDCSILLSLDKAIIAKTKQNGYRKCHRVFEVTAASLALKAPTGRSWRPFWYLKHTHFIWIPLYLYAACVLARVDQTMRDSPHPHRAPLFTPILYSLELHHLKKMLSTAKIPKPPKINAEI